MTRYLITFIIFLGLSFPAGFNRINTVINTPAVRLGTIGQFEMGASYAPYLSGVTTIWEDDYYINYQLTDLLMFGLTRTSGADIVGNMQLMLARDYVPHVDVAVGIEQMAGRDLASTIETISEAYSNSPSLYLAATLRTEIWELTGGIGNGRLMNASLGASLLKNCFFSATYFFSSERKTSWRASVEYDSKDINFGLVLPVNNEVTLKFALTQIPFRTGNNPAYGNVPYENMTFGVDYTFNLFSFYGVEYNRYADKFRYLDEKSGYIKEKVGTIMTNADQSQQILADIKEQKVFLMTELKKAIDDARKQKDQLRGEIRALRDVIGSEGFKGLNTMKEDILNYYYKALQYYYDEKYFEAIGELAKAKLLNDNIPEIHIRMGSIYWTLGLRAEALASWHRAYELDKTNEVLNTFLQEHHVDMKQWTPSEVSKENQTVPSSNTKSEQP